MAVATRLRQREIDRERAREREPEREESRHSFPQVPFEKREMAGDINISASLPGQ